METLDWSLPTRELADQVNRVLSDDGDDALTGKVLQWWLAGFENTETRLSAKKLVRTAIDMLAEGTWVTKRVFVKPITVSWARSSVTVDLVLTDSIFEPEDWSRTFMEGLLRKPRTDWRNADVIEMGIGSGFISITLCKMYPVKSILGLDLNPVACTSAKLNIMINGLDEEAQPVPSGPNGIELWELIKVYESDLLQYAIQNNIRADIVIGCIPQALQPEAPDRSLTEVLYDLGNYCTVQGLVEDSFGLGLNAAAIDQSHEILHEGGSIVLNLAGRPGQEVVRRMFTRRGLQPKTLWRTRIFQAGDTSVEPLAILEADTKTDFEFFLHRQSLKSIPAHTASKVLDANGSVWHELKVYEAQPKLGELWRSLVRSLRRLGITGANRDVDLELVDEEQALFVITLAELFEKDLYVNLPTASGSGVFRDKVSAYLNRYAARDFTRNDIFVGPHRPMTYHSILLGLVKRGDSILINDSMEPMLKPVAEELGLQLIKSSDSAEELAELVELLKPAAAVFVVDEAGSTSYNALRALVTAAAKTKTPLLIDETATFDITSMATGGGIIGALSDHEDASYPIFVIGLEKSTVYPGLSVTIVASKDQELQKNLLGAAGGTYARIGRFHELYYEYLFDDMTIFRMWENPEMAQNDLAAAKGLQAADEKVYLDSGMNKGEMPFFLAKALVQVFLDRSAGLTFGAEEAALKKSILSYFEATRGSKTDLKVSLHHGRWPAIYNTFIGLRAMLDKPLTVGVAGPTENVDNLMQLAGVKFVPLMQMDGASMKLTVKHLEAAGPLDVVYMTNPSLPTGELYTKEDIAEIVDWVEEKSAWLLADEGHALLYTDKTVESPLGTLKTTRVAVFGGVSREFAVGGLRIGWTVTGSQALNDVVEGVRLSPLPNFVLRSTRLLVGATAETAFTEGTEVAKFLADQSKRFEANLTAVKATVGEALVSPTEGSKVGLFCLVDLKKLTNEEPEKFLSRLEQEKGVTMKYLPSISASVLRVNLGERADVVEEGMRRLREFLDPAKQTA